jgi:hypothetical protein
MFQLSNDDPIEFLVHRKFPGLSTVWYATSRAVLTPAQWSANAALLEESNEYRTTLSLLPKEELNALFISEAEKEVEELKARAELEESQRFFNQPYAAADSIHWSKAAHWTLDEAVALSFGKAPEVVHWEAVKPLEEVSPFARQYARLRDLAHRAKVWDKLYDPVLPIIFVNWARDNELEFPETLAAKVSARSSNWVDWKKAFEECQEVVEQTKAAHQARDEAWTKTIMEQRAAIQSFQTRIEALTGELEQARGQAKTALETSAKKMSPIEREGMLKVIYALAVRGYRYDPSAARGDAVSEIVSDLGLEGLSLSDDTVRRYLAAAWELRPKWLEEKL